MSRSLRLAILLLLLAAAGASAEEARLAEISGDKVRLRAGPGTVHAILLELSRGDLVISIGEEGGWRKVRVPGGFPCFVHSSLVRTDTDGTAAVTGSGVLLRPVAGKDLLPLESRLERGDVVAVIDRDGEWLKVLPPERVHAWVFGEYVRDLGPADEFRARIERTSAERRERLLAGRTEEADRIAAERKLREDRETVVRLGETVLDGAGDRAELERILTRIALGSEDDLTRGYANSLLALLGHRAEAERLRAEVARAESEKAEALGSLRAELDAARARYEEALAKAREIRAMRENPFRGVGRVEKRGEELVLVEKERVLFRLTSTRFRLEDYVGRRVGVNGRMAGTDPDEPVLKLLVEKIEILEPAPGGR